MAVFSKSPLNFRLHIYAVYNGDYETLVHSEMIVNFMVNLNDPLREEEEEEGLRKQLLFQLFVHVKQVQWTHHHHIVVVQILKAEL